MKHDETMPGNRIYFICHNWSIWIQTWHQTKKIGVMEDSIVIDIICSPFLWPTLASRPRLISDCIFICGVSSSCHCTASGSSAFSGPLHTNQPSSVPNSLGGIEIPAFNSPLHTIQFRPSEGGASSTTGVASLFASSALDGIISIQLRSANGNDPHVNGYVFPAATMKRLPVP